ncbi:MAG: substrate-binding domain-containing protein [Lawsonibacter sp.]|nr:substrate-binding domain-containing protein [Lawsonibacter sp.]
MKHIFLCVWLSLLLALSACEPKAPSESSGGDSMEASGSVSQPAQTEEPFVFTRDNLPRLDGSTSTVPLAKAMCAVLLGEDLDQVADLINFSRTSQSYRSLMAGDTDLLLAAAPDPQVLSALKTGNNWLLTPFATDALVFVVNQNNPVDNLTHDQVQKIYTGEITNWSEVDGDDLDIIPFQRNQEAGSQTMFEKLVMDGLEPMDAPATWISDSMMGLLEAIREYDNSPAAIGYTVYYYANDMEMAKGLKVLSIDGIAPSAASIRAGEYPFLNPYFVAIAKDAGKDSPTRILYDWVLGPDGQKLAALEGYVPVTATEG